MRPNVHHHRLLRIGGLALAVMLFAPPAARRGVEMEPGRAAPVLLGGVPVIWIPSGIAQVTAEMQAQRVTEQDALVAGVSRAQVAAFVNYLPNLFFLIVITATFYGAIRLLDAVAGQILNGHLVLVYTRAFRFGDRVQIGDTYGDIVATSLLVTKVRTIKNEEVTIPNAIVLGNSVRLHAAGQDDGPHPAHQRDHWLRRAVAHRARASRRRRARHAGGDSGSRARSSGRRRSTTSTSRTRSTPTRPRRMTSPGIYAHLHASIQDAFYAAGVEILSPHFASLRDGNTVAIPEASRLPGARVPRRSRPDARFGTRDSGLGARGSGSGIRDWCLGRAQRIRSYRKAAIRRWTSARGGQQEAAAGAGEEARR